MAGLKQIAKEASERAAKNAGVAPELLYAPIIWTLEDELGRLNAVFHEALAKYPHSHHALHFLWNNAIAAGPESFKQPPASPLSSQQRAPGE
jgi:hypothetical protein